MSHPTDENFKPMVNSKSFDNCSVVSSDVTNYHTLFGPSCPGLRGETFRQRPEHVIPEYLDIPRDFYQLHYFVILTADFMFVNSLPFLTTLSQEIIFGTAEHVPSHKA